MVVAPEVADEVEVDVEATAELLNLTSSEPVHQLLLLRKK